MSALLLLAIIAWYIIGLISSLLLSIETKGRIEPLCWIVAFTGGGVLGLITWGIYVFIKLKNDEQE